MPLFVVTQLAVASDDAVVVQGAVVLPESYVSAAIAERWGKNPPADMADVAFRRFIVNLFVQKKLASTLPLESMDAVQQARVQLAIDKTLAAMALERRIEAQMPTDFEHAALATYRAFPERYMTPAEAEAAHILIAVNETRCDEQARELAEEVRERVAKVPGAFAALAEAYSDDQVTKTVGGSLGRFAKGKMVPEFDAAVFGRKEPGLVEGLVKTRFGYHIIRVDGLFAPQLKTFESVREQIVAEERDRARASIVEATRNEILDLPDVHINESVVSRLFDELKARNGEGNTTSR